MDEPKEQHFHIYVDIEPDPSEKCACDKPATLACCEGGCSHLCCEDCKGR